MNYLPRLGMMLAAGIGVCCAQARTDAGIHNRSLAINVRSTDGVFEIKSSGLDKAVLAARVGAQVNHEWVWSTDYPKRTISQGEMHNEAGSGRRIEALFTGLANKPDLQYSVEVYDESPFGDVQVQLRNNGHSVVTVQDIRVLDVVGPVPRVNLGAAEHEERVLSDSFSEDRPPLRIFDLGKARKYLGKDSYSDDLTNVHFAVGSQLLYNRADGYSLFLAALSAERWLTFFHLQTEGGDSGNVRVAAYAVDCTGTTEVMKKESLRNAPPQQQIELSLSVEPTGELSSEKLMFAIGTDHHAQLENYGRTIRKLRHSLVSKSAPWGWWSWTSYYYGLTEATALTNAQWLARNLKDLGFNLFHIDEGNAYADSEFTTPNAALFPHGIRRLGYQVSGMGLRFGMWAAPFRVSKRAYVYEKHPDWLVHDAQGNPIQIGFVEDDRDPLFVLDTTHPGAQEYLRQTYRTLVREWGVRYFKMDFMDDTAIEGYHYRPNTTAVEAEQIGLKVIREAVGPDTLLDKDGSPMLPAVGYTDLGRTSTDTGHSYKGTREDATGIAARYYMNENFYGADPDAFTVAEQLITDQSWHQSKTPLTLHEAEVSITLAAVAGGMFELGDDLPTLGAQPERLKLVQNKDLLDMVRLQRAAKPVDLMRYAPEDGQPSIFLLREDDRQSVLAVFNWTDSERRHRLSLQEIGFPTAGHVSGVDVFRPDRNVEIANGVVEISHQAQHSVRLIKIVNDSVPAEEPSVKMKVPEKVPIGQMVELEASIDEGSVPALRYHWDFGDGTDEDGVAVQHAYTRNGNYTVRLTVDGIDGRTAVRTHRIVAEGTIKTTFEVQNNRRYEEQ